MQKNGYENPSNPSLTHLLEFHWYFNYSRSQIKTKLRLLSHNNLSQTKTHLKTFLECLDMSFMFPVFKRLISLACHHDKAKFCAVTAILHL